MEQVSRGNCQLNQDPTPPAHLLPELRPELLPAEEKKACDRGGGESHRAFSAWGARANCGGRRFASAVTRTERSSAQDSVQLLVLLCDRARRGGRPLRGSWPADRTSPEAALGPESEKLYLLGDAHANAWFSAKFQPQPAPSRARCRSKTKKNAPRGGLRRSKHASERGLGAGSSLAPSLACRRLSGCRGANGFGSPRICHGRCHSASVRRVCPLDADAPVNGCFIDSPSLSLVKH